MVVEKTTADRVIGCIHMFELSILLKSTCHDLARKHAFNDHVYLASSVFVIAKLFR
jgi:hypothetical protein